MSIAQTVMITKQKMKDHIRALRGGRGPHEVVF